MLYIKKLIGSIVLLLLFARVKGQDEQILRIGDPAPALKYSKWIKGNPITSFDGDQLYVVEFWATWCGPCKAVMPHLTELQKQYESKATFISVNVWEKLKEGQPYESTLPMVEKFVQGNGANMGFAVIADNNEQHMGNNWLYAAGQRGIPSTFIIKNEKVIWIGNPRLLDTLLPKIFDGSYDMAAFKAKFDPIADMSQKRFARMAADMKPVNDAIAAKEYKKAAALADSLGAKIRFLRESFDILKFKALLRLNEKDAIHFAGQWQAENKHAPFYINQRVSEEDNLAKSTYLWSAKLYEEYNSGKNPSPMVFHSLASLYAKGGDYQKAISLQEKALADAKVALQKGELAGIIMEDTIVEYGEALAQYKKAGK